MKNGPALVVRSTIIGCLIMVVLGWIAAGHIEIAPATDIAYAAAASQESDPNMVKATEQLGESNPCQVSSSYPEEILKWCETITEQATRVELPPNLIAAVILQESGGDETSYSSSGAVGLMQVMPRDGLAASFECINGPCFASRPTIEELLDPAYNIEYGSHMLAGLIAREGNVREALKAYGPMDMGYHYADTVLAIFENYR